MTNLQKVDILYIIDKLVIARLPRTIWPMFSLFSIFRIFHLKAREISRQNIGDQENIGHSLLEIVL